MANNALNNPTCPPLMSDGRLFTDYRPSCYVYDLMRLQNCIHNGYDMRVFLIRNAQKLMEVNRRYYEDKAGCQSCSYYLVDPNGQIAYWDKFKRQLKLE